MRKETLLTWSRLHLRHLFLTDSRDENHLEPTWTVRGSHWKRLHCTLFCGADGRPLTLLLSRNHKGFKAIRLPHWLPLPTLLPNQHDPIHALISRDWRSDREYWNVVVYSGRVEIGHFNGALSLDEAKGWVRNRCRTCPLHLTIFDEMPIWMTEPLPREDWDEADQPDEYTTDDAEELWNSLGDY